MTKLKNFTLNYRDWLNEMKDNQRSLHLFKTECGGKPFETVVNTTVYKVYSIKSNYELFFDRINRYKDKVHGTDPNKLLEIFFQATKQLCNEKYKF